MTVRFPIAANADAALAAPLGRAVRESEASGLLGGEAEFVRELAGPAFDTREAALAAYEGRVDAEGFRPVAPEDRFCELVEVVVPRKAGRPQPGGQAKPVYSGGRRWPAPPEPLKTAWRLSVGYWRPVGARPADADPGQAREARRRREAEQLSAAALRRLAQTPMKPVKPQQPLDIGLFEAPLPESPGHFIPDE